MHIVAIYVYLFFQINAAGKRYLDLVKKQWSTNIKTPLTGRQSTIDLRGFYGDYDVIIRYQGKPIKLEHFSLYKEDGEQDINVTVDGSGGELERITLTNITQIYG